MRISTPVHRLDWLSGETAVVGLARSGRAVAHLLARTGGAVYASDAGDSDELRETAAALRAEGIAVQLGGHDLERIARASLVVASPGVPPEAPPLRVAAERGVPLVSEIEIGLRFLPDVRYIAITGSNGKTTTTAMTGRLLQSLGLRAETAGNIGTPLAEIAMRPEPPAWLALELSSFQLHDTPSVRPDVGILTNLSPNHLDRYTSVDEYYGDKARMYRNASASSGWVVNADDPASLALAEGVAGLMGHFSVERPGDAWYDRAGDRLMLLGVPLMARSELLLMGDHNAANALAAALAVALARPEHRTAEALGRMARALREFRALPHRIEPVAELDGVTWINDSKSTNVASTLVAVRGMTRPTVLLLGGKHKGEPYTALIPELARTVKRVIAYGQAAPLVANDLAGHVPLEVMGSDFEEVLAAARRSAAPGDAVLLSPACSSYDMFDHYEQRGDEFRRLVTAARGAGA